MKRVRHVFLLWLIPILLVSAVPARLASASSLSRDSVIASAVIIPAQVSRFGFIKSALVEEIRVKEGEKVAAGQVLVTLDTPELQFAVTAAEAALRSAQAEAELQRYKRVKDIRHGRTYFDVLPHEVIAISDVRVTQAQAALEVAQASLAQSILKAPFEGVVSAIHVVPGELVQLGQVVITLAALDHFQIETTDLGERDITKVNLGDSATISVQALKTEIHGRVIGISPIADIVGGDVVFKVTLALDQQVDGLLWGMTAEVNILTD